MDRSFSSRSNARRSTLFDLQSPTRRVQVSSALAGRELPPGQTNLDIADLFLDQPKRRLRALGGGAGRAGDFPGF
jgi:hypothetical protein